MFTVLVRSSECEWSLEFYLKNMNLFDYMHQKLSGATYFLLTLNYLYPYRAKYHCLFLQDSCLCLRETPCSRTSKEEIEIKGTLEEKESSQLTGYHEKFYPLISPCFKITKYSILSLLGHWFSSICPNFPPSYCFPSFSCLSFLVLL